MSVLRGTTQALGASLGVGFGSAAGAARVQRERRTATSDRLCSGTLACSHCDAPVTIADGPRALTARLTCPFCAHSAPLRDFLSLAVPSRPARVVVRVSRPAPGV